MKVIKLTPQGYCYGVVQAINIVKKAILTEPKPIYVLGDIVHNKLVSKSLENINIITIEAKNVKRLDLIDKINKGTVIFTAHGVSPLVFQKAIDKGLNILDATCPEVTSTQNEIKKYLNLGYKIIFIGKENHPEAEACTYIDKDNTIFISNIDDFDKYQYNHNKYYIAYQSTLNINDTRKISNYIENILYDKVIVNQSNVCEATLFRQEAVKNIEGIDFLIVVGDESSNNSNKLVEISNVKSQRILQISDLDLNQLKNYSTVAITSGASTPTALTKHIINFLENFDQNDKTTWKYDDFEKSVI
ncbi:MAG: 4-hydroxy-3-methylbut-2-enyl diphosphate reductase [Bacilli bacterium]